MAGGESRYFLRITGHPRVMSERKQYRRAFERLFATLWERATVIGKWQAKAKRTHSTWVENKRVRVYHLATFLWLTVGAWVWLVSFIAVRTSQDSPSPLYVATVTISLLSPPAVYVIWFLKERRRIVLANIVPRAIGEIVVHMPLVITSAQGASALERVLLNSVGSRQFLAPRWPNLCVVCGTASNEGFEGHVSFKTHRDYTTVEEATLSVPLCAKCFRDRGGQHVGDSKIRPLHEVSPDMDDFVKFSVTDKGLRFWFFRWTVGVNFKELNDRSVYICSGCSCEVAGTAALCTKCGLKQPDRGTTHSGANA